MLFHRVSGDRAKRRQPASASVLSDPRRRSPLCGDSGIFAEGPGPAAGLSAVSSTRYRARMTTSCAFERERRETTDAQTRGDVSAVVSTSGVGGMIESVAREPLFEFDLQQVDVARWLDMGSREHPPFAGGGCRLRSSVRSSGESLIGGPNLAAMPHGTHEPSARGARRPAVVVRDLLGGSARASRVN